MEEGCTIADAMNTYNIALRIIKSKGYRIFLYPDHREDYVGDFWAIKGVHKFVGGDPLRLLGIISIWENTGNDWQNNQFPEEDIYDEVFSRALPDSVDDFNKLTEKEFNDLISDYRVFFKSVLEKELPQNPSRQEVFDAIDSFYIEE